MAEIEQDILRHDVGFIDFEDENLSLDRPWLIRLLNAIINRFGTAGLELRAMNGLYPPSLNGEVIRLMKDAGFKTLNLSLGSTSGEQLLRFNRSDVRQSFDRALEDAEALGLKAVGYVICGAPFQKARDSITDLLYLARRRVLAGVSVFYPAPDSHDFNLCRKLDILPENLSCLRSSALPLSHTTTREEVVTLLRLARILNFAKFLLDRGTSLPGADPAEIRNADPRDRIETGIRLFAKFLADGRIKGITPEGKIFEHRISTELTGRFLSGLASIKIRGSC
jgi:hypothetical protein